MKCLLINCVGGGPLARLGKQLVEHGLAVESVGEFSYEEWGSAKSAGQIARIISKLRTFGLYPLKALIKATRSDCSTIVCSTNPFLMPWVMTQTRRIHRKKVITLIWDLFPDALESIQISPNGLVGRAMARMNKSAFRDSDGLVFIGREMANHSLNKYPTSKPVRIFATGAGKFEFDAAKRRLAAGLNKLKLNAKPGKIVISYTGNLGFVHDWETLGRGLVDFYAQGKTAKDTIVVIAASGPGVPTLTNTLETNGIAFERLGPLSDYEWAELLVQTDIALVSLKTEMKYTSIPSKTFSSMAAGNAILAIAPQQSDLASLLKSNQCGTVVAPGDVVEFASALTELVTNERKRSLYQQSGIRAIEEKYDFAVLAKRWRDFIIEIVDLP